MLGVVGDIIEDGGLGVLIDETELMELLLPLPPPMRPEVSSEALSGRLRDEEPT
jgi:hypothetical protein